MTETEWTAKAQRLFAEIAADLSPDAAARAFRAAIPKRGRGKRKAPGVESAETEARKLLAEGLSKRKAAKLLHATVLLGPDEQAAGVAYFERMIRRMGGGS